MEKEFYFLAVKYRKSNAFNDSNDVSLFFDNAENYSVNNPSKKLFLKKETFTMGGEEKHRYACFLDNDLNESSRALKILEDKGKIVLDANTIYDYSDYSCLDEVLSNNYNYSLVAIARMNNNCIILKMTVKETVKKKPKQESFKAVNDSLSKNIINNNIFTKEELEDRKAYLTDECGIAYDSRLFNKYLEMVRPQKNNNIPRPKVTYKGVGTGATKTLIKKMIMHLTGGGSNTPHNIILQGAKSTGKNVAWETVAWLINAQIIPMTCSNRMTRSDMFGHASTDNGPKELITSEGAEALINSLDKTEGYKWVEEGAKFLNNVCKTLSPSLVLTPGPITKAMQIANEGNGVILLLNEFNYSDPNTIAGAINDLIDRHSDNLYITDLGNVPISDKLIVGATQNQTGGEYIGTQEQNDALMSRFCCISLMQGSSIAPVLRENAPDESYDEIIELLDNIYGEFYSQVLNGASESCLNIRGFIAAMEEINMGEDIADAVKECVINTVQNYDDWQLLEEVVDNIVE